MRGGREEPFAAGAGGVGVHEGAELVREGGDIVDRCFEIEVEAVDGGGAKGTQGGRARLLGAEGRPDEVCLRNSSGGGGETAFGVGGAADGEEDGFTVGGLAVLDVLGQLGAIEGLGAGEDGTVVAGVGEIHGWLTALAVEGCKEGKGDDVDVRVGAVVGEALLSEGTAAGAVGVLAPVNGDVSHGGGVKTSVDA